jgi:hypothetical protein
VKQISGKRVKQFDETIGKRGTFDAKVEKQSDGKRGGVDVRPKLGDEISRKKEERHDLKLVKEIVPKNVVAGLAGSGEASSKAGALFCFPELWRWC